MKTWTGPFSLLRRGRATARSAARAATPVTDGTAAVAAPASDADDEAAERLMTELTAAALLVGRGVATRVVVCNVPAAIDLDEVRLLADAFDVRVEPIVRVGGGGVDLAISAPAARDG